MNFNLNSVSHLFSYLLKSWDWALEGKPLVPTLGYLNKFVKTKIQKWKLSAEGIVGALQSIAAK